METAAKTLRFRRSAAITVAAAVGFLGALPMLGGGPWYALILLVPLAIALWSWRSGTDVTPDGLVVRAALGSRRVPWSEVVELAPAPKGGVAVRLASGAVLTLPAVPTSALPAIASVGGELTRA
ncbi:PH domain-containing protein [Luedemannella helvata]|uniref:Low molecular weight protein antigen 6 PH domain-containing protein n=1 Tax=Luedemannella helvata TaxID=349315 RepID=A0ABN2X885_9ACTN